MLTARETAFVKSLANIPTIFYVYKKYNEVIDENKINVIPQVQK